MRGTLLAAAGLVICASRAGAVEADRVRPLAFAEVSYAQGQEISSRLHEGPAEIGLPFGLVWEGGRYTALQIGPGWVRLVAPGDHYASSPRLELFSFPVTLTPSTRVMVEIDAFRVAVRWFGLGSERASAPLAGEILIARGGRIVLQYLQVQGLGAAFTVAGQPIVNGSAIELLPILERLIALPADHATGPPPPGCAAPTGNWCDAADGPAADTRILLDSRFEENPPIWSSGPPATPWTLIRDTDCPPGATTAPGQSAYCTAPLSGPCSYSGAFQNSIVSPLLGPITASTKLFFSSRLQFPHPTDRGEILINGTPTWFVDPTGLLPTAWYTYTPLSIPAIYIGQSINLEFRFTASGTAVGQLGWMVDDVFMWDDNGAEYRCVREAKYWTGPGSPYADCSDTLHDDWSFNETEFCIGCTYTFYALVECGTEMHLPLSDMEGAEVAVTDMITGLKPSLTCQNDASRLPPGPPVLRAECCASSPGQETWYGPSWSATDNNGPGAVSWGFPDCPDLSGAYDTNGNGLECSELTPACGGVLSRLSPGEGQGMDCRVAGSPGLCGIFRIDVRSGGFVWNLFANCTGDVVPNFQIYTSCADAWAAFNPLPELAVANVREVGTCPDTTLEFTLQNLGCADHAGDIEVRAVSNCTPPDTANWTVSGGLVANGTRTEQRPMTVTCPAATVTIFVDPNNLVAECSESGTTAACKIIPGSDSTTVSVCGCAGTVAPIPTATSVCVGGSTDLSCGTPVPGASYEWDFEDDGIFDATGCNLSHSYPGAGPYTARVKLIESGGCTAESTVAVTPVADDPASLPALILGGKGPGGLHFQWSAITKAASYRVARGTIKNFYDHTVDDSAGIGMCDTGSQLTFDDADDIAAAGNFYYLVAPISNCGTASPWGNGIDAVPPHIPTTSCP